MTVFGATSASPYTDHRLCVQRGRETETRAPRKPPGRPRAGPRAGPKATSGGHAQRSKRDSRPRPHGLPPGKPRAPPGISRQRHGTLLGWEARSPTQTLPHWAGSAHDKVGTVGDRCHLAAARLPLPGEAAGTLPRAGGTLQTPAPEWRRSLPATTSQQRAAPGTSGPCAGQCPSCRHPEAAPGARHTRKRAGGPGGREQGRWGGWLRRESRLLAQPAAICASKGGGGEAEGCRGNSGWKPPLILFGNRGPESASGKSTPTWPRCPHGKGRRTWRGPSCPWLRWDHPSFPAAPHLRIPGTGPRGCLVLMEAVRVTPAPPPRHRGRESGGQAEPPPLLPWEGLPSTNPRMCRGAAVSRLPCAPPPSGGADREARPAHRAGGAWC